MKTLIIGNGQVGQALYQVVKDTHETYVKDVEMLDLDGVEVMHICYPDHDGFPETTKFYMEKYRPKVTVINSSVSVGTTDKCGYLVYSPVRGRHPKLASDMKIYTKFIFSREIEQAKLVETYFNDCGLKTKVFYQPNEGEFVKLISNIHMGLEIAWRQEVERILNHFKIDPQVYEEWEKSYADGYETSGDFHLIRPRMSPAPIGGHCILPCTDILSKQYPSKIFEFIKQSNERTKISFRLNKGAA